MNPFSALTSKIYGALAIAAIIFAGVQTVRIDGLWFIDGYVDKLADANKTIKQMEQASKDARAAQLAMNKANTDRQTDIARKADNDQTIRRDIADRSSRYAERMSAENYCRKASATSEDRIAEANTSAGPDAVVVSADDYRILTDNTARLVEVREWGNALIAEGLAQKLPDAVEVFPLTR